MYPVPGMDAYGARFVPAFGTRGRGTECHMGYGVKMIMLQHVLHAVSGLGTPDSDSHALMYLDIASDIVSGVG